MKKLFPLLVILLLASCQNEPSFEGLWLGNAYEMDKEVFVPIPRIMIANKDGNFNTFTIDQIDSNWTNWEMKNTTLHIDTNKFVASRFTLEKETFTFNGPFKAYFQRLNQANIVDTSQFRKELIGQTWESEYDLIEFKSNSEIIIEDKKSGKVEQACWSLNTVENHTFILKKGNHVDCVGFYRFPELVLSQIVNEFIIKRWQDGSWQEISYQKVENRLSPLIADEFQLCNPYLYRNNPKHRYYYKGTFYKGGIYTINKLFNNYYNAPVNSKESGLIKVEFIVNCQGMPGRFSMMQFDDDYRLKEFSSTISKPILEFTKTLKDWNAGQNEKKETIDTYRFLTYRIKNGQVVEIFP